MAVKENVDWSDCPKLGSNIWPTVRDHGAAIAAKVDAAEPESCVFIEIPLPPKRRRNAI